MTPPHALPVVPRAVRHVQRRIALTAQPALATVPEPGLAPVTPSPATTGMTPGPALDFGGIAIFPPERQEGIDEDLADRIRERQGGGRVLEAPVQRRLEAGLGHSLAAIRIHADGEADSLSRDVHATAFTSGSDIFFRAEAYDPASRAGQHLLAHEIAHTVQQASGQVAGTPMASGVAVSDPADPFERAASRAADDVVRGRPASIAGGADGAGGQTVSLAVQRFGSAEHQEIGDAATGGELMLTMDIGDPEHPLSYGEMVALAGDYFQSIEEIRALADPKNPDGQGQIRWARAQMKDTEPNPPVSAAATTAAKNRYYALAAKNISHFSAGGTARTDYEQVHQQAIGEAFRAGLSGDRLKRSDAKVTEAFGNHYLTDMFAAGHVRTPRQEIKEWYQQQFPPDGGIAKIVSYLAHFLTDKLNDQGDIPWYWARAWVRPKVRAKIEELGGPALSTYSLGDIVSLAYHNHDNREGLQVVSMAGPDGRIVPTGYVWPELDKGDSHLSESPLTKEMAVAAVRDSLGDIDKAFAAGQRWGEGRCLSPEAIEAVTNTEVAGMQPFAAEKFIPRAAMADEVMDRGANVRFEWKWGALDPVLHAEIDQTVKGDIVEEMGKLSPADMRLNGRGNPDAHGAITLHVKDAFKALIDHLASQGIKVIEDAMAMPAAEKAENAPIPADAGPVPAL